MKKLYALLFVVSLVAVAASPATVHEGNAAARPAASVSDITGALAAGARFVPGQLLVGYERGASEGARADALNSVGALSSFSNYGATTVDLGAPGDGIYSTIPRNRYGSLSGTSMATPHVTGGAALYASTHPGATAQQIRAAILNSVVPTASLAGKTATGGRLDVSGF